MRTKAFDDIRREIAKSGQIVGDPLLEMGWPIWVEVEPCTCGMGRAVSRGIAVFWRGRTKHSWGNVFLFN